MGEEESETPREARHRHQRLRHAAYETAASRLAGQLPRLDDIGLGGVTSRAIQAWRSQWKGAGPWNWEALARSYRKRYARFELAVWTGETLAGLSIGRISAGRQVVSVNFVRGSPDPASPLRGYVILITAEVAVAMAQTYDAERVRFTEPSENVRAKLALLGFTYVAARRGIRYSFCERSAR